MDGPLASIEPPERRGPPGHIEETPDVKPKPKRLARPKAVRFEASGREAQNTVSERSASSTPAEPKVKAKSRAKASTRPSTEEEAVELVERLEPKEPEEPLTEEAQAIVGRWQAKNGPGREDEFDQSRPRQRRSRANFSFILVLADLIQLYCRQCSSYLAHQNDESPTVDQLLPLASARKKLGLGLSLVGEAGAQISNRISHCCQRP